MFKNRKSTSQSHRNNLAIFRVIFDRSCGVLDANYAMTRSSANAIIAHFVPSFVSHRIEMLSFYAPKFCHSAYALYNRFL